MSSQNPNYLEFKLSIITVCFNSVDKIEQTIKCVISQARGNVEYIIIDGGSTDGTLDIVNKYKNQIAVVVSEKDSGIYEAMNKGIGKATGEFIAFLNAGDLYFSPYTLLSVSNYIDKFREQTGLFFFQSLVSGKNNSVVKLIDTSDITDRYTIFKKSFSHMATFINSSLFIKFGRYNEENKITSDYEWLLNTLVKNNHPYKFTNHVVSIFETGGISTNEKHKDLLHLELNDIHKKYFTRLENHLYSSSFFVRIYKNNICKRVIRSMFGLKLNRLYGQ